MDIFRVLNGLVDFQEGVLKFQMNNVFCIFCLKVKHCCMALLCRSREPPFLYSFKTQGRKEQY